MQVVTFARCDLPVAPPSPAGAAGHHRILDRVIGTETELNYQRPTMGVWGRRGEGREVINVALMFTVNDTKQAPGADDDAIARFRRIGLWWNPWT